MKQYTQQEVEKRYEQLPQAVQEALYASATTQKMLSIGRKNGLLLDKIGILAAETGYVMIGLTHPNEFVSRLAEILQIAPMKAKEVAEDINEQVFKSIREHLLELHDMPGTSTAPKKQESFAQAMQQKKEEKPPTSTRGESFVAPMIFPEKMPPSTIPSEPTPTNSDIQTIRKMPLEPSGSWKPPQPITPVFDKMRKQESQIKPELVPQKLDPYNESVGIDSVPANELPPTTITPSPTLTASPEQVQRIIPPAPQFIDSLPTTSLKQPEPEKKIIQITPLKEPEITKVQTPPLPQTPSYSSADPYHEPTE